ncbi:MAG: hypothetical protein H7A52_14960 [Akkermansiaceae bacterium]|nr:hypothetical protein [Akkermansiaceae bacterium]
MQMGISKAGCRRGNIGMLLALIAVLGVERGLSQSAAPGGGESELAGKAVVIPVRTDDLDDGKRFRDLRAILDAALKEKAKAIVFVLNVRGGTSWESHQRLLEDLPQLSIPTVSYVDPSATGAGALLALGTDAIYMAPTAIVGGSGVEYTADEKTSEETQRRQLAQQLSVLKARARSLAVAKGHSPAIAEAFIDADIEAKAGTEVVSPKGEVLTLTAEEAIRPIDGKPLFAKAIAKSVAEVLKAEGIGAESVEISPRDFVSQRNRHRLTSRDGGAGKDADEEKTRDDQAIFGRRDQVSYRGKVIRLEIGEDALATGKARFDFMDRTLKKAELDGASAVILDMDTPGGYSWYTKGLLLNSLQSVTIPTVTFVNTRAESAGAIIAVGTDHIYMRPAATIGSALVISGSGEDLSTNLDDKVTQMAIATVRNMAELKGHNPDVAEAFVTQDKAVIIDGTTVHPAGHVLNLNTIQATEVIGGRPVLAKGIADTVEEIVAAEGYEGEIVDAEPYGMEDFAHWVQKFSFALIIVGLAGAYMELKAPGFGVPGVASLLAFGMFFFGNYWAGNLAGYELAVLFVLGLVLIGVEIFILPGTVIPGLVGGVLVLAALGMAMVDRVDLEYTWKGLPGAESWGNLFSSAAASLVIGLAGSVVLMLLAMRYLPETKFGSWMVLKEAVAGGASIETGVESGADRGGVDGESRGYVGLEGITTTDLRPAGKGRFGDRLLDITADGEFLEKGTAVRVAKHEGSRIVVQAV